MFNIGGAELLVILLVGLLVLGPDKLPEASKKIGSIMSELRQMSNGFKSEMKQAMDVSTETAARAKGTSLTAEPQKAIDVDSAPSVPPAKPNAGSAGSDTSDATAAARVEPESGAGQADAAGE